MTYALCFCDRCGSQGALQSRATHSKHEKAQQARSRLFHVQEPAVTSSPPQDPHDLKQVQSTGTPISKSSSVVRDPSSSAVESRIAQFIRPKRMKFNYPPTSPTAMYPGGCWGGNTWREGPAALRTEDPSNATVLLHVSFLLVTHEALKKSTGGSRTEREHLQKRIYNELLALEAWRMSEWIRQQREAPDPEGLRERTYSTGNGLLTLLFKAQLTMSWDCKWQIISSRSAQATMPS